MTLQESVILVTLLAVCRAQNTTPLCTDHHFVSCTTGLMSLNNSDYSYLGNGMLVYSNQTVTVVCYNDQGQPHICLDNRILYNTLLRVSCSLSVIGNTIIILSFCLFSTVRTAFYVLLVNMCVANSAFDLTIIVGGLIHDLTESRELCHIIAVLLHYCLLSQFFLTSAVMVETLRSFHSAGKLRKDSKTCKHRLVVGLLVYGWGLPLVIVTTSIIVDQTTDWVQYVGYECWISHFPSLLIFMNVPIYLIILFNTVAFIILLVMIVRAHRLHKKCGNQQQNPPYTRLAVAIFCTSGIAWVLSIFTYASRHPWFGRTVILVNCAQGMVIAVAFFLTRRMLKMYWDAVRHCQYDEEDSTTSN